MVNPRTIAVDKNAAYPNATKAMKRHEELWRIAKLRQVKFLNNIVEQDHRRIKRLVRPGLSFKSFTSAAPTVAGYEVMAMTREGYIVSAPANDMGAQRDFIATLFGVAA
jgi:transposase-like protein